MARLLNFRSYSHYSVDCDKMLIMKNKPSYDIIHFFTGIRNDPKKMQKPEFNYMKPKSFAMATICTLLLARK